MDNYKRKAVAIWLLVGVFMIMIQVLLGGVTRLTGSGLSITEWKPIMGTLPPLNQEDWMKAFEGYKKIAQYKYLNSHFTLGDFQFIFFWEWFHRVWARLLGVVFAIGFIYFWVRKYFDKKMIVPFVILVVLGGLQGLIGWLMVQSGLNESDLYVSHIKLAFHFIAALVLLCYTLWFALQLLIPKEKQIIHQRLPTFLLIFILVFGIQLTYGAFMAGLKAAPFAPTWPLINGDWVPATVAKDSWINHPINIQFIHRQLAYLLFTFGIILFVRLYKLGKESQSTILTRYASYMLLLLTVQVVLGIFTVLLAPKMGAVSFGAYELLAEAHQLVAMLLLSVLVVLNYLIRRRQNAIANH